MAKVKVLKQYRPASWTRQQPVCMPGDEIELEGVALELALAGGSVVEVEAPAAPKAKAKSAAKSAAKK